ncbi:unnamed protein product [Closterium sp. NIES-65]|nr:unnamed protein product [Closterium sp. NIES-65]
MGVVVPNQPAARVTKHGAVVDFGAEDHNTKLTRMQVEHYGMKRDLAIWKAAVTAVGAAMGYSVDQLLAGAAHVLQAQGFEGGAATPGGSRSTAPSTPNPRAAARPCTTDSPGSKGGSAESVALDGAGSGTVELGVVHPSPCALPVPAAPSWSINGTEGSMHVTHQAEPAVAHACGARPVVLAMPAKRKREDPHASGADAEGGATACKSKGKGQGCSSQYKGVRREKRGRWSAKILFREKNKKKRTQMRLGAYNKELEAATAYAAAVHVVKDGKRVSGTVELTDEEKGMLEGCTLASVKRLVRSRQWFRWQEWETALVDCTEEETAGDDDEHSDSQDDDAGDAAGCAVEEGDEVIELDGEGLGDAEGTAGRGTPPELNEDAAAVMGGVADEGIKTGVALGDAFEGALFDEDPEAVKMDAAHGASQVSPNAAVASSVGAGDEDVGSDGEGEAAPVRSKAVASVMAEEPSAAKGKAAASPLKPVAYNPFEAMPCAFAQPASGSRRDETVADDAVVISRADLEALKTARDEGERRIARLEALLLAINDREMQNKRPKGHDKTLGLCWVTPRLTLNYAGLALAADKARCADLNKALSQWKTEVTGRVRDIALPRIGLWRNERDRKSPWARKKRREAAEVRLRYRVLDDVNEDLTLSTWRESRTGMIFASGAFMACVVTAFQPKKVTGAVTVKLYQMAWLEHVVTDTVFNWDKLKARLSNSAGGNAEVVNGLHQVAEGAMAQAIQDFKPKYDADAQAWVWGEHGLMMSSCGLEHLIPGRYAQRAPIVEAGGSAERLLRRLYERLQHGRGVAKSLLHMHEPAVVDFEQAVTANPSNARLWMEAVSANPGSAKLWKEVTAPGNPHLITKCASLASPPIQAVSANPGSAELRMEAASANPDSAELWMEVGVEREALGQHERAHEAFSCALLLQPGNAEALKRRGLSAFNLNRFKDSLKDLLPALHMLPNDADLNQAVGIALVRSNQFRAAQPYLARTVELLPLDADLRKEKGRLHRLLGETDQAERDLLLSLQLRHLPKPEP